MKKRNSVVIIFIAIIVLSMSYNRFEWPQKDLNVKENEDYPKESLAPIPFIVGIGVGPDVIDPINSWDYASYDVISQVAETLFWYNVTNPNSPLEPLLAESYSWDVTDTELTLNIRDNVYFHDGLKLNASAVKWNMDRILYFTNATGDLPMTTPKAFPASLYFHNGISLMNRTEVISEMVVKIILNQPFGSFLPLLSCTSSSIISPTSHNATEYVDLTTEALIGTGPFVYDGYVIDTEVSFHSFENYWNGQANITNLIFEVIGDSTTRNNALLNKDIHFLARPHLDFLDQFNTDPLITVEELGPDLIYRYLAFDCYRINVTWREAISKAINYTYIIEEIQQGTAVRGPPAVPENMPGHDPTVVVAQYDIPEARIAMQSMGFGVGWDVGTQVGDVFTPGANETLWLSATFFQDSYGHQIDLNRFQLSGFNEDLNNLIAYNLDFIGIVPIETIRDWETFLDDALLGNLKGMWYLGWGPDYIDPFIMLDPLFNPNSPSSYINLTDSEIVAWLAAAAVETDIPTRYGIFSDLQHKLFEVLYAHTPLMAALGRNAHIVHLTDYPYNSLGNLYFYPCTWDLPLPTITIITPSSHALYGDNAPSFSISIDCLELNSSWYTIDNGITNITFTGLTSIINQTEWDKKGDGTVTIIFYANDTLGMIGNSEVVINKDITTPVVTIISPEVGDIFAADPPTYNITVTDANLDIIWYTLDNGATNITISGLIGVINEDEWNAQPNGYVTISFYANDTLGKIGSSEVVITKDVPTPVITIISPEVGDTVGADPPIYSINVNSAILDTIWYTLDNGATNIIISELIGVIDETEWSNQPDGYVTIRFYANDTLGGEGTALVIVTKDTPPPEIPPGIPGANLLVIYLMLFIGIPILIWQRKKIIKH